MTAGVRARSIAVLLLVAACVDSGSGPQDTKKI